MSSIKLETRQHLRELEQQRYAYLLKADVQAYSSICHPELILVHSTGSVETKESFLSAIRNAKVRYHQVEHPIHSVVVADKIAVVIGDVYAKLSVEGIPVTLSNRTVATWIRKESDWLLISHVGARILD